MQTHNVPFRVCVRRTGLATNSNVNPSVAIQEAQSDCSGGPTRSQPSGAQTLPAKKPFQHMVKTPYQSNKKPETPVQTPKQTESCS